MKAWRKTAMIAAGVAAVATTLIGGAALAQAPTSEVNPFMVGVILVLGILAVVSIDSADSK